MPLEGNLSRKRHELKQVRRCKAMLESKRSGAMFGTVYLMEMLKRVRKPLNILYVSSPDCPYKIGATKDIKSRSRKLWNRKRLVLRARYATTVPFLLESALHRHFDEFRVRKKDPRCEGERKNERGELFRLPPEEAEDFKTTVAKVEQWVLVAEESRLELEILRLEAAVARTA